MFKHCKQRAMHTLRSNNITEFPIPIHIIEQIIIDLNFDIVIVPGLTKSCILSQTLFTMNLPVTKYRASLAHELGHILFHEFFIHSTQFEARADAFAAYFLMPSHLFKIDALRLNIFELADLYSVPINLVKKRMELLENNSRVF